MAEGKVGSGHQNRYLPKGNIELPEERQVEFEKGEREVPISRDEAPCWSAGTPVKWDDSMSQPLDGRKIEVSKKPVKKMNGQTVDILVSTGDDGRDEFHPLIQLYNQIMADIFNHGMGEDLDNLRDQKSAGRLWEYLERRYLKRPTEDFLDFLESAHNAQIDDKLKNLRPSRDVYKDDRMFMY